MTSSSTQIIHTNLAQLHTLTKVSKVMYVEARLAMVLSTCLSTDKPISNHPKNISEKGYRCVCLNARSIVNKKNELNIMVEDIDPHIIGITESWANIDITDAELGLTGV